VLYHLDTDLLLLRKPHQFSFDVERARHAGSTFRTSVRRRQFEFCSSATSALPALPWVIALHQN
jgi:hypothetical protein